MIRPIQHFMHREAAGGIVLAFAVLVALAWANLDFASYDRFWHAHLRIEIGGFSFDDTLRHVVNDGLMTLFFFVIGLEIKREFVVGELRDRRAALLPVLAAVGGMLVPALAYVALTRGEVGSEGWGIPMATDIAFALGVLALLGRRVPMSLKVLLLGIAVIDDIGAIIVIAIFYSDGVSFGWLFLALLGLLTMEVSKRLQIRAVPLYMAIGVTVWYFTRESGIHATIAGIVIGLLTPARPFQASDAVSEAAHYIAIRTSEDPEDPDQDAALWNRLSTLSRQAISPLTLAMMVLHPWTSYVVLPMFALANVGIVIDPDVARAALSSPVGAGILVGLVIGKPLGILAGSIIAVRLGIAQLPERVGWLHVAGIGALAGMGFTVSLFISTLAFEQERAVQASTFAVLVASLLAGVIGATFLGIAHRRSPRDAPAG